MGFHNVISPLPLTQFSISSITFTSARQATMQINQSANTSFAETKMQTNTTKTMKTKQLSRMNIMIHIPLAMILALGVWSPIHAQSAEPAKEKMPIEGMKMESCKVMMEKKQEMIKEMKAQDAALSDQAAKMNSAPSDKKTGLMADIVTQLVGQRMARDERKAKMEEEMMQHMMQHMKMGKDSMAQCPMMKGMKHIDDKSGGAHKDHQKDQK